MKIRILLAFIFLLVEFSTLSAQKYQSLIEDGKTWDVIYWGFEGLVRANGGTRFFVEGDTVFQNILYKILRGRSIYSLHPVGLFVPPFALSTESGVVGLIREDTLTKKVYVKSNSNEEGKLLYDFDLKVGDTINAYLNYPNEKAILDSISLTEDLNGKQRHIFYFNYLRATNRRQFYIEGIGGEAGLLSPFCNCFEGGSGMTCVQQKDTIIYTGGALDFSGNSCNLTIVGTKNLYLNTNIQFTPNPTTNVLFIKGLENFTGAITLYDNLGRTLLTQSFENSFETLQIDLRSIPKGIFFCSIQSGQEMMTKKVVKH